jgi:hypothetical protein
MKTLTIILAVLAMQLLTGCFQAGVTVHVKPDGSGTVDQTITMSEATIAQFKAMAGGKDGQKGPHEIDEAKLKEQAAKMGEGVTFVSAKPIKADGKQGFTATFAFADISKIKVEQMPNMGDGGDKKDDIGFQFTKGSPATLTITMPPTKKNEAGGAPDQDNDQMMGMMKEMFKDMSISFAVDVQGAIQQTNATHRDGQKITLLEMEFAKVMADPVKFKAFTKVKDPNTAEAKALLKTIPGVKIETESPITISFQ